MKKDVSPGIAPSGGAPTSVVRSKREVYRGRRIALTVEQYERRGTVHEAAVVRHPGAVVLLPVTEDGRVLLIRQYRYSIDRTILELPAGTLEPGEAPAECAARELIEETGFTARTWQFMGELVPAPGFCDELQYLYLARDLSPASAAADEDEEIEVVAMTCAEVEEAIRAGKLWDAKSIACFSIFALRKD